MRYKSIVLWLVISNAVNFAIFTLLALISESGVQKYRLKRMRTMIMMELFMIAISYAVWSRLCECLRSLDSAEIRPGYWRWRNICLQDIGRALLLLFLVLSHVSFGFYYYRAVGDPNILACISLVSVALYLHLFLFLFITEVVHGVAKVFVRNGKFLTFTSYIIDNRNAYSGMAVICAALFVLGGFYAAIRDPVYTSVSVHMRNFGANTSDMKVALLTDIHIGPTVGRARIETITDLTNSLNPDIIAISGDLADGFVADYSYAAAPLCNLRAKYGVYFATGNHEYMHGDVEEWFTFLRSCNITVLHNQNSRIPIGDTTICVAGMDDLYSIRSLMPGHQMLPHKALSGCKAGDATIVLAHQPNAVKHVLAETDLDASIDLILSGHTHGGQFYPLVPLVYLANAFTRGKYYVQSTGTYVVVSAGVNYFGPPVKMFGACEIIDITLTTS